jgi:ribonucleoside-diphosphate reductase alpha chain
MATDTVTYAGISVKRVLSKEGVNPFESVTWENREARIDDAQGNIVFRQEDVRVPAAWSQTALNIVASKYFHGRIGTEGREKGVDELIARVISTIREAGDSQGYFSSSKAADTFQAELTMLLLGQYASFNSPLT